MPKSFYAGVIALLVSAPVVALADNYPSRPIRFIVPFAAGGGVDVFSRFVSKRVGEILDQSVIVENRVGGGGIVGPMSSLNQHPMAIRFDYDQWSDTFSELVKAAVDPVADFVPVTMGISYPLMFGQ